MAGKAITREEFDNIKLMFKAGLSPRQIKTISKRSDGAVYTIAKMGSYEQYKEVSNARFKNWKKKEDEQKVAKAAAEETPRIPVKQVDSTLELAKAFNNFSLKIDLLIGRIDEVLETKKPWLNKMRIK